MKKLLVAAVVAAALVGGVVWAALPPQLDPATVPYGWFAVDNHNATPFKIKFDGDNEHVLSGGSEVFVRHVSFTAGQSSGWHTHPGPLWVSIVKGSLTLYDGDDPTCTGVTYGPGQLAGEGFIDRGFGHVHIAIGGSSGADFYNTYVLPAGSATPVVPAPTFVNSGCPNLK